MSTTSKASKQEEGKVIKKKKAVVKVDANLFVSPSGVPKVYRQVASLKFPENNRERLRMLMGAYSTWGRELCPTLDFNDFMLKMEKFSGAHVVRQMLDTLRRGEEWDAERFAVNTNTTNDTDTTTDDATPNQPAPTFIPPTPTSTLTEQQQERIARNRAAAIAKQASQQRTADEEVELEMEAAQQGSQRTTDEEVELEIEEENNKATAQEPATE